MATPGDEPTTMWLRRCNLFEQFLDKLQREAGAMLTCYALTLHSREHLSVEHVKEALLILQRRVVTLRLRLLPRTDDDGRLWMAEMEEGRVDFQTIEAAEVESTMSSLTRTPYEGSEGPLWRVRLSGPTTPQFRREQQIPEVFHHEYKILFGFHHSITDGFSSTKICGFFMNILNDVITGKSDACTQLAHLADSEQYTSDAMKGIMESWAKNPDDKRITWDIFENMTKVRILMLNAYPITEDVSPRTLNIRHDFSKKTSKSFISKCKSNSVTCHLGFFTATQLAVVDLLRDAGVDQEEYDMITNHVVNGRRYWNKNLESADVQFGSSISVLTTRFLVKNDAKSNFWDTARKYSKMFMDEIHDLNPLKRTVYIMESMSAKTKVPAAFGQAYYDTTNMGDITNNLTGNFASELKGTTLKEEDKSVIVSDFHRSTSTHVGTNICSHVLQTLKGRMLYSLDYNVRFMSTETAKKYRQAVVNIIEQLAEQ